MHPAKQFIPQAKENHQAEEEYRGLKIYRTALQEELEAKAKLDAHEITEHLSSSAPMAVKRVNELVQSKDENVATKNAHYVIDHLIGKAKQRSENLNLNVNVDLLAD